MTREQELAISRMNKALRALKAADIYIASMDSELLYATGDAINRNSKDWGYPSVANAVKAGEDDTGTFKERVHTGSGGW